MYLWCDNIFPGAWGGVVPYGIRSYDIIIVLNDNVFIIILVWIDKMHDESIVIPQQYSRSKGPLHKVTKNRARIKRVIVFK